MCNYYGSIFLDLMIVDPISNQHYNIQTLPADLFRYKPTYFTII